MSRYTLVLAAAALAGCTSDITVDELVETTSFPPGVSSVEVDVDAGSVQILARADGAEGTWLEVTSRWSKIPPTWTAEVVGSTLVVTGDCRSQRACATHMRLGVPTFADTWIETGAGEVRVGRIDGDVIVATDAGSIEVFQQRGRMELETKAGGIEAWETRGDLFAFTDAGSIEVTDHQGDLVDLATDGGSIVGEGVTADDVAAHSDAGSVELSLGGTPSRVEATSDAGAVFLDVPGGAWRLDLDTGAGAIRVDGVTHDSAAGRTLRARTGAGDLEVHGR